MVNTGAQRQETVLVGHPVGYFTDGGHHLFGCGGGEHDCVTDRFDQADTGVQRGAGQLGEAGRQPGGFVVAADLGEDAVAG